MATTIKKEENPVIEGYAEIVMRDVYIPEEIADIEITYQGKKTRLRDAINGNHPRDSKSKAKTK